MIKNNCVSLKGGTFGFTSGMGQSFMLSQHKQQGDWCIMADISKIRIKNSMVPNFVMKLDHTLQLTPHKIWAI